MVTFTPVALFVLDQGEKKSNSKSKANWFKLVLTKFFFDLKIIKSVLKGNSGPTEANNQWCYFLNRLSEVLFPDSHCSSGTHLYIIHLPSVLQTVKYFSLLSVNCNDHSSHLLAVCGLSSVHHLFIWGLCQIYRSCRSSIIVQTLVIKSISLSWMSKPNKSLQVLMKSPFRFQLYVWCHAPSWWEINPDSVHTLNYPLKNTGSVTPNLLPGVMCLTRFFLHGHVHI